ncbi:hypothetical protein BJ322DRAFT_1112702 [Thelephora terrestris]|uniref:Uncharacterized protein n=1 Tax=Thelephora terrestris TaxID=56493 RepID=A0A9P6H7A4_9AGAM|nr:hypothetical protein BJ322DRAFT_1112702 [Thelephora terrestris]
MSHPGQSPDNPGSHNPLEGNHSLQIVSPKPRSPIRTGFALTGPGDPQANTTEFTFAPPSPFPESAARLSTLQHIPPFMDGLQGNNKRKDRPNPPTLNLNDPVSFPRPASIAGSRANSPDSVKKPKTAHTKISQTKSMGKRRMSLRLNASLPSSPVISRRISSTDPDRNIRERESMDITHRMQERLASRERMRKHADVLEFASLNPPTIPNPFSPSQSGTPISGWEPTPVPQLPTHQKQESASLFEIDAQICPITGLPIFLSPSASPGLSYVAPEYAQPTPTPAPLDRMRSSTPTFVPSILQCLDVQVGFVSRDDGLGYIQEHKERIAAVVMDQSFKASVRTIDGGDMSGDPKSKVITDRRFFSEPVLAIDTDTVHIPSDRTVHTLEIPIPPGPLPRANSATIETRLTNLSVAVNGLLDNSAILLHRQEFAMGQNLVNGAILQSNDNNLKTINSHLDARLEQLCEDHKTLHEYVGESARRTGQAVGQLIDGSNQQRDAILRLAAAVYNRTDEIERVVKEQPQPILDTKSAIDSLTTHMAAMQKSLSDMEKKINSLHNHPADPSPQHHNAHTLTSSPLPSRANTPRLRTPTPRPPTPKISTKPPYNPATHKTELNDDQYVTCFQSNLHEGFEWFVQNVRDLDDDHISWWARVVSLGRWGYINEKGFPTGIGWGVQTQRKRNFLYLSIQHAFGEGNYNRFLLPPSSAITTTDETEICNQYNWQTYSGRSRYTDKPKIGPISINWAPGWTRDEMIAKSNHYRQMLRNSNAQSKAPSNYDLQAAGGPPQQQSRQVRFNGNLNIPDTSPPAASSSKIPSTTPSNPPNPPGAEFSTDEYFPRVDLDNDSEYYEDTHKDDNTTKPATKSYASVSGTVNTPLVSKNPNSKFGPPAQDRRNIYVLKFPRGNKPTPGTQIPPPAVISKINTACEQAYNIKAMLAKWTQAGNLSVTFSPQSSIKSIDNASGTIIKELAPDYPGVTFAKPSPWSRIVYKSVPCRAYTMDEVNGDEMAHNATWSKESLLKEVKASHPLLATAKFIHDPDWTLKDVPDELQLFNLTFTIEDPDGSTALNVRQSEIHMFATRVRAVEWTEKIHLKQCPRCWMLDATHSHCAEVCRLCGSTKHTELTHNTNCQKCLASKKPIDEISSANWRCIHFSCRGCGQAHPSDSLDCQSRSTAIAEARKKKKVPIGQTILDPSTLRVPAAGWNTVSHQKPSNKRRPNGRPYALKRGGGI